MTELSATEIAAIEQFREFYRKRPELVQHPATHDLLADFLIENGLTVSQGNLEVALRIQRSAIEKAIDKLHATDLKPPKPAVQRQEPMVGVPGRPFAPERPESDFSPREIEEMSAKDYREKVLGRYRHY